MLVTCWTAKGGAGCTTLALLLARHLGARHPEGALLVDLGGDVPFAAGAPEPPGPGVAEWLTSGALVPADGLARLEVPLAAGVRLLPRGAVAPPGDDLRAEVLAEVLAADPRPVVVDAGLVVTRAGGAPSVAHVLATAAGRSLLVMRPCLLALRRAQALALRPTGVVLVDEPGRALGADDVEQLLGVPVVGSVPHDPVVARRLDAGLLALRVPRAIERSLRWVA